MKIGMEDLVRREIVVNLLKHNFLKNLSQRRENSYRPIILALKYGVLLVKRNNLGKLPAGGELALHNGQGDYVMERLGNDFRGDFNTIVIKLINCRTFSIL